MFGIGRKGKPRSKKRRAVEDRIKYLANKNLLDAAEHNPNVQAAIIKKYHGIEIEPVDVIKATERRIEEALYSKAERRVTDGTSDDGTDDPWIDTIIDNIINKGRKGGRAGYDRYVESINGQGQGYETGPVDVIHQYRELEQEFGGRGAGGFMQTFQDPTVMKEILGLVKGAFLGGKSDSGNGGGGGDVHVIVHNGREVRMSEDAYMVYMDQQRQLRSAPARGELTEGRKTETATPAAAPPVVKTAVKKTAGSALPAIIRQQTEDGGEVIISPIYTSGPSAKAAKAAQTAQTNAPVEIPEDELQQYLVMAELITGAMDEPPEQFVNDLVDTANSGNTDTQRLIAFLQSPETTYEKIMELVAPYKDFDMVSGYIQKFVDKKEWVEQVIAKIKELPQS